MEGIYLRRDQGDWLVRQREVLPHLHLFKAVSLMPNSRSLLRVRLLWLFRAVAFLSWVLWISAAVRSSSFAEGRWSSHQYGIKAASAVCTWHSVNSAVFPPRSPVAFAPGTSS